MDRRVLGTCLIAILCLFTFTGLSAETGVASSVKEPARQEVKLPPGVSESWWATVKKNIEQDLKEAEYGIKATDTACSWEAKNITHNFVIFFSSESVMVVPNTKEKKKPWDWGLKLTAYGPEGAVTPVANASPRTKGTHIEYDRGNLTEWYENDQKGIEQGFTIKAPPASSADSKSAAIIIEMEILGSLKGTLREKENTLIFSDQSGAERIRFGKLQVYDANKKPLASSFALRGNRLQICLAAVGAQYPITIDPLATSPGWTGTGENANDEYGLAVASAGDVNGDGFSDVIVGAYGYGSYTGRVYVYHGSASGLSTSAATVLGEGTGNYFGYSVASAGDVNGDGYSDIIVGAPGYSSSTGRVYVYHGSASGLSTSAATVLTGEDTNNNFGNSLASAGDVNGDGYSDIIVGTQRYGSYIGRVYIYHGSASGLSTSAATILTGEEKDDQFGWSVASAGDVNGDGYGDVIVGAYNYKTVTGRVYVYHGSASGLSTSAATVLTGEGTGNSFGGSVASAGDVNGDGYSDVVVGAIGYNNLTGRVYVYHGSASGLSTSAATVLTGEGENDTFGTSVGSAGDVNGDGYSDVIVSAPGYNSGTGRVYVYYGSSSGLSTSAATVLTGEDTYNNFGNSLASAGDVNGDGYSDIIVGAHGYSSYTGRAYTYYGSASGLSESPSNVFTGEGTSNGFGWSVASAGDVNGDGYSDVIVSAVGYSSYTGRVYVYHGSASGLSTSAATVLTGEGTGNNFGSSVASAGDVNGDGYSDIIVSAVGYSGYTGRVYVYHGSASGLSASAATVVTGEGTDNYFGYSVASAGDVNGDGYSDVIVGAYGYSSSTGRVYVYHGSASGLSTSAAAIRTGEGTGNDFGYSVASAGDVNGDGYSDVIVGAYGYSSFTGRAYVYHGSGSGLSESSSTVFTGEGAGDYFGYSVASAGDVNGDGYSDVIAGAPWSSSTGRAYVYHGSASGLSMSAATVLNGEGTNASFGLSVASAGDVNGDGYSDIIVGASGYNSNTGRVYVYHGSASGLSTSAAAVFTGEGSKNYFGYSVASAGDVNGDGYSDVIVGAYGYGTNTGRACIYHGGGGSGVSLIPQQKRWNSNVPVSLLGKSDVSDGIRLGLTGKTPYGRNKVKLQWEIKPLGTPFDGVPTGQSSSWQDSGTTGYEFLEQVGSLAANTPYHWRVRLLYNQATAPLQLYSRWLMPARNGLQETEFRTNDRGILYADFTGAGIWQYDGSNWNQLNVGETSKMTASGNNLYANFEGYGLWQWNGTLWSQLNPGLAANMTASGSNLYVDFTGYGLWAWNGTTWTQINTGNTNGMTASGNNVYANFSGYGLWQWNGSTWNQINTGNSTSMTASGSNLYANFAGYGIWQWNGSTWSQINTGNSTSMTASGTNLYANFAGYGLWQWNGTTWTQLNTGNTSGMAATGGNLYANFAGYGLWKWDGSTWSQINTGEAAVMVGRE